MDPEERARVPSMAMPFALVGVAAVVFSLVAVSALRVGPERASLPAALFAGAVVGGGLGVALRRWPVIHDPMVPRGLIAFRVSAIVVISGAAIGAALGYQAWGGVGALPFAAGGGLVSLAFVPACLTVLDAGRRAARARMGSVVAGADRRTIWATALSAIAVTSLAGVPALLAGCAAGRLSVPQQASLVLCVAVVCAFGGLLCAARDRAGIAHLRRFVASRELEEAAGSAAHAPSCVDVGLGDAAWSPVTSGGTYRAYARQEVTLKGDVGRAISALDEAYRARAKPQALAALSIVATLATCMASDMREVGAEGCFRRVRIETAGCNCVGKSHFPIKWPK